MQCGDPDCAPIDTVVKLIFENQCGCTFGVPCEAWEVEENDIDESMPPTDHFLEWKKGNNVPWPPDPVNPDPVGGCTSRMQQLTHYLENNQTRFQPLKSIREKPVSKFVCLFKCNLSPLRPGGGAGRRAALRGRGAGGVLHQPGARRVGARHRRSALVPRAQLAHGAVRAVSGQGGACTR